MLLLKRSTTKPARVPITVSGLTLVGRVKAQQKPKPRKKVKAIPPEGVRKSSRLHGGDAQLDNVEDEATQFAMFIIDGAVRALQASAVRNKQVAVGLRIPLGLRMAAGVRPMPEACV